MSKIKSILIVGGGTSGWMTATYLNKVFGEAIKVTLVESSNISTVGVGEATFSTVKLFFDFLGLVEDDWMPFCNASYKMGIKFVDWNKEKKHFYHPFQRLDVIDGFNVGEWWLKHKNSLPGFDYSCFATSALCDNKRSPKYFNGHIFDITVDNILNSNLEDEKKTLANLSIQYPYAYHFNASLLARYLTQLGVKRGVSHLFADVSSVSLNEDGQISSVSTKSNQELTADLFIDCTGFSSILMGKISKEPFISFSESLLCDTALATQIPKDIETDGINPYTTATALSSGWVWNIPLYGRDGTGYVFSSNFISNECAEDEFRTHLGEAGKNCNLSTIKMRIGRNENAWVKNCVAIGLSNAFVEPLESTGIFFIQHAIEELVSNFPDKNFNPILTKRYNKAIGDCIDGVRDFLILHYYGSTRIDSPFWNATNELKLSNNLLVQLEEWKCRLPNSRNINHNYHGFEAYSYTVMLQGLGYSTPKNLPILDHLDSQNVLDYFGRIKINSEQLIKALPSQYEYLTQMRQKASVE